MLSKFQIYYRPRKHPRRPNSLRVGNLACHRHCGRGVSFSWRHTAVLCLLIAASAPLLLAASGQPRMAGSQGRRRLEKKAAEEGRGLAEDDHDEVVVDETGRVAFDGQLDFGFCSHSRALKVREPAARALVADCEAAFVEGGVSFWVGAHAAARCGLEELALLIFRHHTRHAAFDSRRSGVEWWIQVRRGGSEGARATRSQVEGASIGLHWDKDEDLVDLQGLNIHPHISTVTYLTGHGAPTLVCEQRCPVSYAEVPDAFGDIPQAWLSYPLPGKHISFDGGLLHGAPNVLAPLQPHGVRITFLANVWLNYHPSGIQVALLVCARAHTHVCEGVRASSPSVRQRLE